MENENAMMTEEMLAEVSGGTASTGGALFPDVYFIIIPVIE